MTDNTDLSQSETPRSTVDIFLEQEYRASIKKIGIVMILYGIVFLLYIITHYAQLLELSSDSSDIVSFFVLFGIWGVLEFATMIVAGTLMFVGKIRISIFLLIVSVLCAAMYLPTFIPLSCWLNLIYKIPPIAILSYFVVKLIKSPQFRNIVNQ